MLVPKNVGIDTKIKSLCQILWKLLCIYKSQPSWISQIAPPPPPPLPPPTHPPTPWISLWASHRWILSKEKEKNFNWKFWVRLKKGQLATRQLTRKMFPFHFDDVVMLQDFTYRNNIRILVQQTMIVGFETHLFVYEFVLLFSFINFYQFVCYCCQVSVLTARRLYEDVLFVNRIGPQIYHLSLLSVLPVGLLNLDQTVGYHYNDVIMGAMASQITSLTIVYSSVYSGADQRKHQSSASLASVLGIHRWPVNIPAQRASNAENVFIWWRHHDVAWWPLLVALSWYLPIHAKPTASFKDRVPVVSSQRTQHLTPWGRVICVAKLIITGRRQAIIWTNAGILLIGRIGTNLWNFNRKLNIYIQEVIFLP